MTCHYSRRVWKFVWILPLFGILVFVHKYVSSKTVEHLLKKHDIPNVGYVKDYNVRRDKNRTSVSLPTPVIVISYQRSGSTFVGNIVRLNGDVFYFFEPLHFLLNGYKKLHYLDLQRRSFDTFLTAAEFVIRNVITCKFQPLPLEFWEVLFYPETIQGYQLTSFYQKFQSEVERRYSHPSMFENVLVTLENTCKSSKTVIIKTIRTPLFLLRDLLSRLENLKIIHLIRDPRATISSQIYFGNVFNSTADHAYNFCTRVYNDVTTFDIFSVYYPSNLIRLMYESLAINPLKISKDLYAFLNIIFSNTVANSVQRMTSSNVSQLYPMFPLKTANSKQLKNRWRLDSTVKFVMDVDSQCYDLYQKLGYIPVSSEDMLRNLSIPLFAQNEKTSQFRFGHEIPTLK